MARFLAGRLLFALLLIVASSSAAFWLTRLAPGDVTTGLGPFAPPEQVAAIQRRFGLDRHPAAQWAAWIPRAARLQFGDSFLYNRPVGPLVIAAAWKTALLGLVALGVATVLGLGGGIFTGSRRTAAAAIVRGVSLGVVSMPPLVTSIVLVFVAARTGWLPAGGMESGAAQDASWAAWVADVAWHLPVPVLALALPIAATFERLQSQAIADTVRQPFVVAAAARGVPERDLILRHAWPVSLRPITAIYGVAIGAVLSGSFVVEYVTAWPGLGRLMFEALHARDIYLVAGCAAMGAALLAAGTLMGDLVHAAIDPRTRSAAVGVTARRA
jgi:peptide/nickel transport system permease protein